MDIFISPAFAGYYAKHPLTVVDVGARGGIPERWEGAREHLRVLAFEPDPEEYARLCAAGDPAVTYFPVALHGRRGTLRLNVTRSGGASSVFEPDRAFLDQFPESERFDILRTVEVAADTLDNTLAGAGIDDVDAVKVDTQGSERDVLLGAERILRGSVFAVEVEVEFSPLYVGQPLFRDVDGLLYESGFRLFDLRPSRWKRIAGRSLGKARGQLVFADALYLREPREFRSVLDRARGGADGKLLRSLSVCVAYGYLDYAAMLYERYREVLPRDMALELEAALAERAPLTRRIGSMRGMGRVVRGLRALADSLEHGYGGWATGGRRLGND